MMEVRREWHPKRQYCEAKGRCLMKKLKKFAALLLAGALVLSVLTGCGKSDAKIVKDVLNAMTQAGEAHKLEDAEGNTRIYENKELAAERDKILALFKAEDGRVYDVNSGKNVQDYFIELYDEDDNLYGAAVCTLERLTGKIYARRCCRRCGASGVTQMIETWECILKFSIITR